MSLYTSCKFGLCQEPGARAAVVSDVDSQRAPDNHATLSPLQPNLKGAQPYPSVALAIGGWKVRPMSQGK